MIESIIKDFRRDIEEARSSQGMSFGMPMVRVDVSRLEYLCNAVEELRQQIADLHNDYTKTDSGGPARKVILEHYEALHRERDELRRENERLRTAKIGRTYIREPFTAEPAEYDEPTWLPAPDSQPADLADAQMVEIYAPCMGRQGDYGKAGDVGWHALDEYRPLYSASGLPLCSPEGLEPKTTHVAKDELGMLWQFQVRPTPLNVDGVMRWCESSDPRTIRVVAPESHRCPGPWRESLMEVMR